MLHKLRSLIRNYFGFSQTEINGFLVIALFLVGIWGWVTIIPLLVKPEISEEQTVRDQQTLDSLLAIWKDGIETKEEKPAFAKTTAPKKEITLFAFDPNTISVAGFEELGLPSFLAERIEKYREKGGKFRIKADFKKIYGLREEDYNRLYDYIDLPEVLPKKELTEKKKDAIEKNASEKEVIPKGEKDEKPWFALQPFDLNSADTTQLKLVKGIGSAYASKIVKFREALGGFHSLEQLKEVYGVRPEAIEALLEYARLENPQFQRININSSTTEELARHPYISWKLAKIIMAYRDQHGNFSSEEDLRKVKAIKPDDLEKMLPYLSF